MYIYTHIYSIYIYYMHYLCSYFPIYIKVKITSYCTGLIYIYVCFDSKYLVNSATYNVYQCIYIYVYIYTYMTDSNKKRCFDHIDTCCSHSSVRQDSKKTMPLIFVLCGAQMPWSFSWPWGCEDFLWRQRIWSFDIDLWKTRNDHLIAADITIIWCFERLVTYWAKKLSIVL